MCHRHDSKGQAIGSKDTVSTHRQKRVIEEPRTQETHLFVPDELCRPRARLGPIASGQPPKIPQKPKSTY